MRRVQRIEKVGSIELIDLRYLYNKCCICLKDISNEWPIRVKPIKINVFENKEEVVCHRLRSCRPCGQKYKFGSRKQR